MDSFRTISKGVEGPVFKDKKSKFIGYALPIGSVTEIDKQLDLLRIKHPNATHICYAWKMGIGKENYRVNDDGEPHNSAGMPILRQIKAFELTDILIAVVRYYGGKKLGVGGLVEAYRTAAKEVLEKAPIIERELRNRLDVICTYDLVDQILQKARRYNWTVLSKQMEESCRIGLGVKPGDVTKLYEELGYLQGVEIKEDTV